LARAARPVVPAERPWRPLTFTPDAKHTMKRIVQFLVLVLIAAWASAQSPTTFVFVKIAESIQPIARGSKYEDPLDSALKAARLGEVTGGGSQLSKEKKIEWVGVDVELTDIAKGIPFLRAKLIELGAPKGSTLEYEFNGKTVELPIHGGA
jgi:hypothetical protein